MLSLSKFRPWGPSRGLSFFFTFINYWINGLMKCNSIVHPVHHDQEEASVVMQQQTRMSSSIINYKWIAMNAPDMPIPYHTPAHLHTHPLKKYVFTLKIKVQCHMSLKSRQKSSNYFLTISHIWNIQGWFKRIRSTRDKYHHNGDRTYCTLYFVLCFVTHRRTWQHHRKYEFCSCITLQPLSHFAWR